ncbi:MAG: hypothetical protein QOC96_3248 [Acidobacteriota bacterium]|jgi:hypothetical protein|nr:hypothetical protein [Acidobacteriota bacterium]
MNLVTIKSLRLICLLSLITVVASLTAHAQDIRLQLNNLDKLEARARDSVDVTLDGALLHLAEKFLNIKDPKEAAVKELLAGLKGIYVKSFEFDKEGEYSTSDVDAIRAQLRAPGWSRMIGVKSKKDGENAEVYMMMTTGSQIGGIVVIATNPKQLTVVNIIGTIDLDKLSQLSGKFGIPSIELIRNEKKTPKE